MAIINVGNSEVDVDITAELQAYDFGYNARWTSDKLVAQSPFRSDNTPSFFINLSGEYAGHWGDSGAVDEEHSSGNFVALLAYLRGESTRETAEYLLGEYGALYEIISDEPIRIPSPKLKERTRARIIVEDVITQATSPYLITRGISAEVQAQFGVGYNAAHTGFTGMSWKLPDGRVGNVKYRSTSDKRFFYEENATPVREMVYGIDVAEDFAVLVEGEIDAMSWAVAGISAIAVGGSALSRTQAELIKRSKIRTLALGGDNDGMGRLLNERVRKALMRNVRLVSVDYGEYNDANDVLRRRGVEKLRDTIEKSNVIRTINIGNNKLVGKSYQ